MDWSWRRNLLLPYIRWHLLRKLFCPDHRLRWLLVLYLLNSTHNLLRRLLWKKWYFLRKWHLCCLLPLQDYPEHQVFWRLLQYSRYCLLLWLFSVCHHWHQYFVYYRRYSTRMKYLRWQQKLLFCLHRFCHHQWWQLMVQDVQARK